MITEKSNSLHFTFYILYFLLLIPYLFNTLNNYDEGIILVNALRVSQGDLPYRDFWTIYMPGQFYVNGLYILLLGKNLLIIRILQLIVVFLFYITIHTLIRQLTQNKTASLVLGMSVLILMIRTETQFYASIYPALLGVFTALLFLVRFIQNKSKRNLYYIVFSLSFIALFRHDFFIYTLAGIFLFFVIFSWKEKFHLAYFIKPILILGLIIAAIISYFFILNIEKEAFQQLFIDPFVVMPKYRKIPVEWKYYLYPISFIIIVLYALYKIIQQPEKIHYYLLLLSIIGMLFTTQLFNRADSMHALPVLSFLLVIGAIFVYHLFQKLRIQSSDMNRKNTLIAFLVLGFVFACVTFMKRVPKDFSSGFTQTVTQKEINEVVLFFDENLHKKQYVFVGVKNHDLLYYNDIVLYFLLNESIATQYSELHPGIADTEEGQKKVVNELKSKKDKYIVLSDIVSNENNLSSVDKKIGIVNNFISSNYVTIFENKNHKILKRKP